VVVPDLRGYGDSAKPPAGPDNAAYSRRALALDQVETMASLGFDRFAVAGQDSGARVAQYRAGASVGLAHDRADRGRNLTMPLLVLWGQRSSQGSGYDVLAVWHEHAETVSGHGIEGGHFLPEEAPEETYRALQGFFAGGTS